LHMYDHAVFNVDWSNLRYHACSEVCLLTHIQAFTNIVYTLQDSCEQFEWRLLLGTRDSARQILLLKATPGTCVPRSTVHARAHPFILPGVCPKTCGAIGHGEP
jgi:hypothetical protein